MIRILEAVQDDAFSGALLGNDFYGRINDNFMSQL